MDDVTSTYEPSPRAESSRASARPGSARSTRSNSNSIDIKRGSEINGNSMGTEALPLSAREFGSGSPPGPPSRELSRVSSKAPSAIKEGDGLPLLRENSDLASSVTGGGASTRSGKGANRRHSRLSGGESAKDLSSKPWVAGVPGEDGELRVVMWPDDGGLISALDNYLKTNRVRLMDLFNSLDRDGNRRLDLFGLRQLALTVLPDHSDAQLAYFQALLDVNGQGSVDYGELMEAAREMSKQPVPVATRPEVTAALDQLQAQLLQDTAAAQQQFKAADVSFSDGLSFPELAAFLKALLPDMQEAQRRAILSYIHAQTPKEQLVRLSWPGLLAVMGLPQMVESAAAAGADGLAGSGRVSPALSAANTIGGGSVAGGRPAIVPRLTMIPGPASSREQSRAPSVHSLAAHSAAKDSDESHGLSVVPEGSELAASVAGSGGGGSTRSGKGQGQGSGANSRRSSRAGGGEGAAQDLKTEAMPWNELKSGGGGSRTTSVVNSIAPYVGQAAAGGPAADVASSRDGKLPSRPATPSGSVSHRSAKVDTGSRPGSAAGHASPDPDTVLAGSPPLSRESSKLATPSTDAASHHQQQQAFFPPDPSPSPRTLAVQMPPPAQTPSSRPPSRPGSAALPPNTLGALSAFGAPSGFGAASSAVKRSAGRKSVHAFEPLPWSELALADYRAQMKRCTFELLDPADNPLTARMDQVFSLPTDLWPVLPPGAIYCLEAGDPRVGFSYLQHVDFPDTKVRVGTYFGKWGRHLVDFVVSWQPTPRQEAAWQAAGAKQPPQPWEPRQVVAHTTGGEYQYANTRMKFRGPQSPGPGAPVVDWCDAHGIDLLDTKAANETAPRNSDKDRDAHLLDPPRPNTWGEMARRPLIGNLRSRGGGAYVHHISYDYSGLRTTCGRRVPAGYFFTLVPNAPTKTPAVPGGRVRSASAGRSLVGGRSRATSLAATGAEPSASRLDSVASRLVAFQSGSPIPSMSQSVQALLNGILDGSRAGGAGANSGANRANRFGGGAAAAAAAATGSRPLSAGTSRRSSFGSAAGSGVGLLQMESYKSFGAPSGVLTGLPSAALLGSQASRLPPTASPTLFALAPKQRWRTYDIPFHHPIHTARAQDLGAAAAAASGTGVRVFSDAAAVLQVAEQELRMPKPFVPGPIVVDTWDDIPRLYAEHMAAARALMPVTELDTFASSKLHQLVYHLQHAATLEFDRLDAKLALLPQMARLGRKSAEIDAWLQVIVEHAAYLYDKIQITDTARWFPQAAAEAAAAVAAAAAAAAETASAFAADPDSPPLGDRVPARRSVTFSKGEPLVAPNPSTAPAPIGGPSWAFPEPLAGTSFAERSALNVAAQRKPPPPEQQLPAHRVTVEEWAGVTKVMDTCRHAILYDHWIRLRPLMTGKALPGPYSGAASRAGSTLMASSDAGATIHDFGADPGADQKLLDAMFSHGMVNQELLDYVKEDVALMSTPDFKPSPPPPETVLPPPRGYRGPGPLPPELVAEMPEVHRPARIRGVDETPLPPQLEGADLWNITSKADQVTTPDMPDPLDVGALRFSQMSVSRLEQAKGFAASRQAEVRRSMQRALGQKAFDESSVPEYGSDIAEDELESMGTGNGTDGVSRRRASRRHDDINPSVAPLAPGIACQTAEDLQGPSQEDLIVEAAMKARQEAEAAETRRKLLTGNGGKSRDEMLEEALAAAEAAILSLRPRPIGATNILTPPTPKGMLENGEPLDSAWKPFGRGQAPYNPGADPLGRGRSSGTQNEWYKQQRSSNLPRASESAYGKGPEPLALEKVTAEPSSLSEMEAEIAVEDMPPSKKNQGKANTFGAANLGIGGLVDYETAMARRRAIAGAELALDKSDYLDKSEVFNLFVTYCNLNGHPELVDMLQHAIEAPISAAMLAANSTSGSSGLGGKGRSAAGAGRNAAAAALLEADAEAERQRIRATAWLLGVTWRRITNETYTSFLSRVLGWPHEAANCLHRTRCTQIIAKALVRGHDIAKVPKC